MFNYLKEFLSIHKLLRSWKYSYDYEFEQKPDIRNILKTSLYIHKFSQLFHKKLLLKKALENQWWQYFNHIFPDCIEQNPLKLPKYLPISFKKVSTLLEKNNRHCLIIQSYLLNGWSLLLLLIISKLAGTKTPLYIVTTDSMCLSISNYLKKIFKQHGLPDIEDSNIFFLNSEDHSSTNILKAFKNGGIIFTLLDSPLPDKWDGTKHTIQLLKNSLTVGEGILNLAAKYNIAILPVTSFFHKYKLHLTFHPIQIYTHISLNPSTVVYTLEKLYEPLALVINKYPEKWIAWNTLKSFNPVFNKNPSTQLHSPLLWYSYRNSSYIINLETGEIIKIYKPIFNAILISGSRSIAHNFLASKYPNITTDKLAKLLNIFYPQ